MKNALPVFGFAALIACTTSATAATLPDAEISAFYAPTLGSDFKNHSGGGISGGVGATYDFNDSRYGEQLIGRFEGIYLRGSGTNDIGGPSHHETLDAGFGMLNLGVGARWDDWSFAVLAGFGFGGGSLSGNTTDKALALDTAVQIKPRVTWYFAKRWALFAEYRYLHSASIDSGPFSSGNGRALSMSALGLGVAYTF